MNHVDREELERKLDAVLGPESRTETKVEPKAKKKLTPAKSKPEPVDPTSDDALRERYEERRLAERFVRWPNLEPKYVPPVGHGSDGFKLVRGIKPLSIFAPAGHLKTFLAMNLTECLSLGIPCRWLFNFAPEKEMVVLYLDYEQSEFSGDQRLQAVARGLGYEKPDLPNIIYREMQGRTLTDDELLDVVAVCIVEGVDALVIDTFSRAIPGRSQVDPDDLNRRFRETFGVFPSESMPLYIIVDHESGRSEMARDAGLRGQAFGGNSKEGLVQTTVGIKKLKGGVFTARVEKSNECEPDSVQPTAWTVDTVKGDDGNLVSIKMVPTSVEIAARAEKINKLQSGSSTHAVYHYVLQHEPVSYDELKDALVRPKGAEPSLEDTFPASTIRSAKKRLIDDGLLCVKDDGSEQRLRVVRGEN